MKKRIRKAKKYLEWEEIDQAIAELKPVLKREQQHEHSWIAYHLMGIALSQKGEHASSARNLKEAIDRGSDVAETPHMLSVNYYNLGHLEEAERYAKEALERRSDFFKAWLNLGSVYRAQAKLEEALECYKKANQLDPRNAGVAFRIGEIYRDQGDLNKAIELFDITLKIDANHKRALLARAEICKKRGNYDEAKKWLKEARERGGSQTPVQVSEAELYKSKGDYDKAISLYEELLEKMPDNGVLRVNYALCLQEVSRFDQSEKHYRRAIETMPENQDAISNYLMGLHYNPQNSKEKIFEEHVRYGKEYFQQIETKPAVPQDTAKDKRLKVGFVSGGFRRHPVGWMIVGALEQLPEDQFEIYCYTTDNKYDFITRRIHQNIDVWRSVVGYNNKVVDKLIREDELDILVDLSGHAADNFLKVMVRKPAPIVVKWVGGLFNTTGLEAFDYLISDRHETPEGEEEYYIEKLVKLPDDYIIYTPPGYAPDIAALPAERNGYITFGCFNNPTKVNEEVLGRWARVMNEVPKSRLYLKSKQYSTASFRKQILEVMERNGVDGDRIKFKGKSAHDKHLDAYNQVDIALDPWPYSGGLTTCEAILMGVPVITLPGPTFAGRHSTTHLINAGLDDFVVKSWEEYTRKAVELANDWEKLKKMRATLRDRIVNSPVCDGKRFGAHLAVALRRMWEQWVEGHEKGVEEWQDHIEIKPLPDEKIEALTEGPDETAPIQVADGKKEKAPDFEKEAGESEKNENQKDDMDTVITVNGNGRTKHGTANGKGSRDDAYHIETKDGVTVCTPKDLELLTPFVLLEQEEWFEPELNFMRDYLKPGMKAVDVGAAFGAYALPMAKKVGREGAVYAFEPGATALMNMEMSKLENNFEQLEVMGQALGNETGKKALNIAETPELNTIGEEGDETVSMTTLDAWWNFAGHPEIDVIKLDANGMEREILEGGQAFFEESAPLILFSTGGDRESLAAMRGQLDAMDYELFEYIPGPGLLTEHQPEEGMDLFLMNLVALKKDRVDDFRESGWIYDEKATKTAPDAALWKEVLGALPWADEMMEEWADEAASGRHEEYMQALNMLCAAEKMDAGEEELTARSRKGALLLEAAQRLIDLFNNGRAGVPAAMTFVRVMYQLGKRTRAVEMMKELVETVNTAENIDLSLPFLPPLPEQDQYSVQTDFSAWLTVRIVEAWILMKEVSTYMSGEQEKNMLKALEGNKEVGPAIKKNNLLMAKVEQNNGHSIHYDDYNDWFWKAGEAPANGVSGTGRHVGVSEEKKILRHIYLGVPGRQGGAHGIHEIRARKLAKEIKRQGVDASIISTSSSEFVSKVTQMRNKPGHVFYTGVMGYDLSVQADMGIKGNLFDMLDMPVFGFLGDHPYTEFMWYRMEHAAKNAVFLSPLESLVREVQKIYPDKSLGHVGRLFPLSASESQKELLPLADRPIDILIPWGLHKFMANQEPLETQLRKLGSLQEKLGLKLYQDAVENYEESLFEIFLKVTGNKLGRPYEFSTPKTREDRKWLKVLSLVDWSIRKDRRLKMMRELAGIPDEYRVAVTAHPKVSKFISPLEEKKNVEWIGEVSRTELDELYRRSGIILNCNPTFPDKVHARIQNGMVNGCFVITDYNPGLENLFGEQDAIGFTGKYGKDIADHLAQGWDLLQEKVDKGRQTVQTEFSVEKHARRLIEIITQEIS